MGLQVVTVEGLLDAEQVVPVELGQPVDIRGPVALVGIDLYQELRVAPAHRRHRTHVGPGADLELHPGVSGRHQLVDPGHQPLLRVVLAHHRAGGHRTVAHPDQVGEGRAHRPKVGIAHRHLQGGGGERRRRSGRPQGRQPGDAREPATRHRGGRQQARHQSPLECGERPPGVLGVVGGIRQGRTLPPPLHRPAVGPRAHDPHEHQRPVAVHPPGRPDRTAEPDLDPMEFHRLQDDPTPRPDRRPGGLRIGGDGHGRSLRRPRR